MSVPATATATAAQLHALHSRLVAEGLTAEAAWVRARLPPLVTADHLSAWVFARDVAPSLDWGGVRATTKCWVPLMPLHETYDAALMVTPNRATFLCGGLRWEEGAMGLSPQAVARALANRAGHYLARWRDPDDLSRRDFMRHRKEAVHALHAATCWALDNRSEP